MTLINSENAIKQKIDYRLFIRLQNIVLNHFGFKNVAQIRDKFEGQAYYEKFLMKSFAEIAFQKILKEVQYSIEQKEKFINFKPSFNLGPLKVEILCRPFDGFPLVSKHQFDIGILFVVDVFYRQTSLVGFAEFDEIEKNLDRSISPLLEKNNLGYIKNFEIFKPLNSMMNYGKYFI